MNLYGNNKWYIKFLTFILVMTFISNFLFIVPSVIAKTEAESKEIILEEGFELTNSKTRSTFYTPEKVEAARRNVQTYDWAKSVLYSALNSANHYLSYKHDYLWNLVTPQSIPRGYAVNQPLGCLNCGKAIDKYGNYPYTANHSINPWKLECPNCRMKFPTNDFGAYYKSGLDEHNIFNPELADKSLLVNTLYPEKGENWGVDDGYGYIDEKGNRYTFIAYYNHWHIWHTGIISKAINSLRDAFIYTGDMKYARAGVILLDRIADVYPDMDIWPYKVADGFLNSNGHTNRGKIIGSIWETGLVEDFIKAYDAFFPVMDDPEIIRFLSEKADMYDLGDSKKSAAGIKRNIEDGILRQIYPAVQNAQIRGNNGMHQSTLAIAAVVLDTMPETKEWLDFNFQSGVAKGDMVTGGNILATFINDVDRNGFGNESAPGYNRLWLGQYIDVANILHGYDLYPGVDLYENPKFKKMFYSMISMILTDKYSAIIGDTASTGNPTVYVNISQTILAYERYKDPLLAQVIYFLNGNTTQGLHGDIFSSEPDKVAKEIENTINTYGPLKLDSENLTGYGFAVMRDGHNITYDIGIQYLFKDLETLSYSADVKSLVNNRIQFEATQPGDNASFIFKVMESNEYQIDLKCIKSDLFGLYDIYLDGTYLTQVDFYGRNITVEKLTKVFIEAGEHEIRFECIGKNEESTGYKMGITTLVLLDETAQAIKNISLLGDTQKAVWMYYGVSNGHGHADTLNIGINAFGLDLTPELGYPEYADTTPHRTEWVNNTISHNTVVVDKSKQETKNKVENPLHFDAGEYVRIIDVDAPLTYQLKDIGYRRTTAMIKVNNENFYVVDFFRVQGGSDHHFSFHGAEGSVTVEGLDLISQTDNNGDFIGTYAGPNVEFGEREKDDLGNSGFQWLMNVRKDNDPGETFSVEWNIKDTWNALGKGKSASTDIRLRLTMLEQTDDVAIGTGIPPRNKQGNPKELEYLVAHRAGNNLDSIFTSVIEPYKGERFIKSIEKIDINVDGKLYTGNDARAVKVEYNDGRIDYLVYSIDDSLILSVDDKFVFKGFFCVYSERDGIHFYSYVNDGEFIDGPVETGVTRYTGTVLDFTKELSLENEITVRFNDRFDTNNLTGRHIYIQNNDIRNAVYKILGIKSVNGNTVTLNIGDVTTVRRWVDNDDFDKGFLYFMTEGNKFVIPLSVEYISPVTDAFIELDGNISVSKTSANITVRANYETGASVSINDMFIEIISTNPKTAYVKDGIIIFGKPGRAEIFANIKINGKTIRTNIIPINININKTYNIPQRTYKENRLLRM